MIYHDLSRSASAPHHSLNQSTQNFPIHRVPSKWNERNETLTGSLSPPISISHWDQDWQNKKAKCTPLGIFPFLIWIFYLFQMRVVWLMSISLLLSMSSLYFIQMCRVHGWFKKKKRSPCNFHSYKCLQFLAFNLQFLTINCTEIILPEHSLKTGIFKIQYLSLHTHSP